MESEDLSVHEEQTSELIKSDVGVEATELPPGPSNSDINRPDYQSPGYEHPRTLLASEAGGDATEYSARAHHMSQYGSASIPSNPQVLMLNLLNESRQPEEPHRLIFRPPPLPPSYSYQQTHYGPAVRPAAGYAEPVHGPIVRSPGYQIPPSSPYMPPAMINPGYYPNAYYPPTCSWCHQPYQIMACHPSPYSSPSNLPCLPNPAFINPAAAAAAAAAAATYPACSHYCFQPSPNPAESLHQQQMLDPQLYVYAGQHAAAQSDSGYMPMLSQYGYGDMGEAERSDSDYNHVSDPEQMYPADSEDAPEEDFLIPDNNKALACDDLKSR